MPRFFAELSGKEALISGKDARHIAGPLRMRPGDEILIRQGTEGFSAIIKGITRDEIILDVTGKDLLSDRGKSLLHLGISLIDIREMDDAVRLTTELGVASICPVIAERSNIRAVSEAKLKRWEDIINEAVKQSQRRTIPILEPPVKLPEFIKWAGARFMKRYYASMTGSKGILDINDEELCFVIGPEGGFTEKETGLFDECGYAPVNMGKTTLRTLAAAVAAASILCI